MIAMGNTQDVMNDFAMKELKNVYSTFDGWKITPGKTGHGYDSLIRLDRMNQGHHDIVKVLVSFSKDIPEDLIDDLMKKEKPGDGTIPRYDAAVIVPVNANTSALPQGMKVFTMNAFEFKGNDLMWVKKKVAKVPEEAPKKAA
jgi:hypothetical protein